MCEHEKEMKAELEARGLEYRKEPQTICNRCIMKSLTDMQASRRERAMEEAILEATYSHRMQVVDFPTPGGVTHRYYIPGAPRGLN